MAKRTATKAAPIHNLVVVSDLHCGCQLGLCPAGGVPLDEGGTFLPSVPQRKVWAYWREFWDTVVPEYTHGEPFAVVCNGDAIDGSHHGAKHQHTQNLTDQVKVAYQCLKPVVDLCGGRYYHIRGTEAHVGKSAEHEEALAERLDALPNDLGQHARYDLWIQVGGGMVHLLHHIGTTGSAAAESVGPNRNLIDMQAEAAMWGHRPPDLIVRSHRHRYCEVCLPAAGRKMRAVVTPAWQLKTPFAWKLPGAAIKGPQFGGVVIRWSEEAQCLFVKEKVWSIAPSKPEVL